VTGSRAGLADRGADTHEHFFFGRPEAGQPRQGRLLLIAATATWTAYNDWGGSNHYQGYCGPNRDRFSPVLSIERPLAKGFVSLPPEARRALLGLARELRQAGFSVEIDQRQASLKSQMKRADRLGCPLALVLGADELASGTVTLRRLQSSQQERVPVGSLLAAVRSALGV
jgi:hypothetical protein